MSLRLARRLPSPFSLWLPYPERENFIQDFTHPRARPTTREHRHLWREITGNEALFYAEFSPIPAGRFLSAAALRRGRPNPAVGTAQSKMCRTPRNGRELRLSPCQGREPTCSGADLTGIPTARQRGKSQFPPWSTKEQQADSTARQGAARRQAVSTPSAGRGRRRDAEGGQQLPALRGTPRPGCGPWWSAVPPHGRFRRRGGCNRAARLVEDKRFSRSEL